MKLAAGFLTLALSCACLDAQSPNLPLVAIVGQNQYTETTDFIIPFAVLKQSGAARVVTVAMNAGPIELFPALKVRADLTAQEFDTQHPGGADYVIVPAVHRADDPALLAWIQNQAAHGAVVVGVCDGVRTVAAAGLLSGRQATGHWYALSELEHQYPGTSWLKNKRYVRDGSVITTTGVSASVPVSLFLVETLAGRPRAEATARSLGLDSWNDQHDSAGFQSRGMDYATIVLNAVLSLASDTRSAPIGEGFDELALALATDAYGRTGRSPVVTLAAVEGPVVSRRGLVLLPDRHGPASLRPISGLEAGLGALDGALSSIEREYGAATASLVASQEEYERGELATLTSVLPRP